MTSRFLKNIGWMGMTEVVIRVSQLAVVVVLGRLLSSYDFGQAAIVMTVKEFVDVLGRNGIGTKLIQAPASELEDLSQTAYWLNWFVGVGLFVGQCLAAPLVAWFYKEPKLILPICALALIYPLLPMAEVQSALILRENRLNVSALSVSLQTLSNAVLSIFFAFLGWGLWAIVAPHILVAPIWVIVHLRNHSWRPPKFFTLKGWRPLLAFGRSILAVEFLQTFRQNLDYLLVGQVLGLEKLGLYYFAFKAGLGLSLSLLNALSQALFPHLCEDPAEIRQRFFQSFRLITFAIVPAVLLQASLAYWYVPLIYGSQWIPVIPMLIIICLSAIPRPFAAAASLVLVALNRPQWDLLWSLGFTLFFALALLIGLHWDLLGVAVAVTVAHWFALPLYTAGVAWYVRIRFPLSATA